MNDMSTRRMLDMAYRYLSYKPRSVNEMRKYLHNKKASREQIESIIGTLTEKEFLDDCRFAAWYIENRVKFNPRSIFAMQYELRQKGISSSISDPILSEYDNRDLARRSIQNRLDRWKGLDREHIKKKMINHLNYRGFSYSVTMEIFESIINEATI